MYLRIRLFQKKIVKKTLLTRNVRRVIDIIISTSRKLAS